MQDWKGNDETQGRMVWGVLARHLHRSGRCPPVSPNGRAGQVSLEVEVAGCPKGNGTRALRAVGVVLRVWGRNEESGG